MLIVALHKDNEIYHIPNDLNKQSTLLNKFYYEKFIDLFKSNGIDYKLINYESYDGEFYIGRFAHALQDKELHSKCFDELYKHYGEKMWPNKSAYYYYDDKVRQYDLLKKFNIETPSIICKNFDELLQNISVGKVFKSTYGAGSESVSYIWENKQIDKLEDYINRSYNNKDFFPCMVQDYIDVENVAMPNIMCDTNMYDEYYFLFGKLAIFTVSEQSRELMLPIYSILF